MNYTQLENTIARQDKEIEGLEAEIENLTALVGAQVSDDEVLVLTRDNPHIWAGDNGGPVEITDEMIKAGADIVTGYLDGCDIYSPSLSRLIAQDTYAAMEAKRREGTARARR